MPNQAIQLMTKKILQHFNVTQAPIPVEQIAEKMNIKISYAPSTDYSGILIRKDGGALMGINSDESPGRRRFTVAHELGHYFLEKGNAVSIDYRDNNSRPDKTVHETNADFFAANLLMPKWLLANDYKSTQGSYEERLVRLSERYQVSREAMMWRLKNLNLR
ncbi:MAG: ImmA/IrrE family metallo-endopeptidase [Candidatus Magasanikbacteria bacterium]|jgi:Zn-dependent peptidase ImmA (M78 family)